MDEYVSDSHYRIKGLGRNEPVHFDQLKTSTPETQFTDDTPTTESLNRETEQSAAPVGFHLEVIDK